MDGVTRGAEDSTLRNLVKHLSESVVVHLGDSGEFSRRVYVVVVKGAFVCSTHHTSLSLLDRVEPVPKADSLSLVLVHKDSP